MLKQIIAIVVLSVVIIFGMSYTQQGLQLMVSGHGWISNLLKDIFTGGQTGNIIRQLIALLAMPIVVAFIPAVIYWFARRKWFPYFMELLWVMWLVQTSALVIIHKVG